MPRQSKGSVGVEANEGRLRLRLPRHLYGGKQVYLYLNLPDTEFSRESAKHTAREIERDIFFDNFDPSLEKYKPKKFDPPTPKQLPVQPDLEELWQNYSAFKAKSLSPSSLKDFRKTANHIQRLPTKSLIDAQAIASHLTTSLSADAAKRVLIQINACCTWAIDCELITDNPFQGKASKIKVYKNRKINPFTKEERDLIINGFQSQPIHQHYAALVQFFFLTGCRTSEGVGLLWRHIDSEITTISFQEVVVDGRRNQTTKTHKSRKFPINRELRRLLLGIRPTVVYTECPVFTDKKGNLVRPNNFLRRHWQPVVKALGISYRPQYNTRHTFITLCLEAKVPIAQVAAWVGNSPRIILEHYAGLIRCEVPEL